MEDPVVPLERSLYGHPSVGLSRERQFEKVLLEHGWEKVPNWECLFVNREKGLFLSVHVDDIKLAGKKQNIDPKEKVLMKHKGAYKKFLSRRGNQKSFTRQFLGIWQVLRGSILESLYVDTTQIGNKCDCRKSIAQSERRDICGAVAVWSW